MEEERKRHFCAFTVYFGDDDDEEKAQRTETKSMQEAFEKFRRRRQEEFRRLARRKETLPRRLLEPSAGWQLRMKFLQQAQRYLGMPYAKKYHQPGSLEYGSPLFLDCCGFLRRVVRDLAEDFGFYMGSGNQAYQYDTLPITLPSEDHLRPGDLIFISGIYFDPQRKRQPHDIVHVEIWLGEGGRSLGARWKYGRSQVFDSYKFISSSYRDMKYHFKSIETWLQGICVSHCPEHEWASARDVLGKRSIFYPLNEPDEPAEEDIAPSQSRPSGQPAEEGTVVRMASIVRSLSDCGLSNGKQVEAPDLQVSPRLGSEVPKMSLGKRDEGVEPSQGQDAAESFSRGGCEAVAEGEQAQREGGKEGPVKALPADQAQEASGHREDSVSELAKAFHSINSSGVLTGHVRKRIKKEKSRTGDVLCLDGPPPVAPGWMNERPLDGNERAAALRLGFRWFPYYNEASEANRVTTVLHRRPADSHPRVQSTLSHLQGDLKGIENRREKYSAVVEGQTLKDLKTYKQSAEGKLTNEAKSRKHKTITNALLRMSHLEEKKSEEAPVSGPFFYIGGANGAEILNLYCKSKGWQRIYDNRREDYILKWCETKFRDSYYKFREGEQLLYQISNNKILTTKIGLLMNLREYERVMRKVGRATRLLKMEDFFPETFRLDIRDERDVFFQIYREPHIWICKPTSSNQGRGIFLLKSQAEVRSLQARLQSIEEDPLYKKLPYKLPPARIVQRYIDHPLLLEGKKFDVRSYLLIACTTPYMVFFGHGYVRLTCLNYDPRSEDLTSHLTNQYVQKKSPMYAHVKEETVWLMERFNTYVNEKFRQTKGLPGDWVFDGFTKRMKEIMLQCFLSVKSKLECKLGYFDLIGCDFLIDEDFKVWLLEMNANPALHTNCGALRNVIPKVVNETLDLASEIFTKAQKNQNLLPLESLCHFALLYNGTASDGGLSQPTKSRTSLSSVKIPRPNLEKASSSTGLPDHRPADKQPGPPKVPEKVPRGDVRGEAKGELPEGLAPPPSKGARRNPLPMPQIQISIVPSLTCCPSVKNILRSNQVCTSGNQYIIKPVPAAPASSAKAESSEEQGKAPSGPRGTSKDNSYTTWFQQTFGAKLQSASGSSPGSSLTSSQMLSLHLQSGLPPNCLLLPEFPKPFSPVVDPATGPVDDSKPSALAVSQSCSESLPEDKKISHRSS